MAGCGDEKDEVNRVAAEMQDDAESGLEDDKGTAKSKMKMAGIMLLRT